MPVELIETIQATCAALQLGKVSYLVFGVIHVIALHALATSLILNHTLNALTITSLLHLFHFLALHSL